MTIVTLDNLKHYHENLTAFLEENFARKTDKPFPHICQCCGALVSGDTCDYCGASFKYFKDK